ncbi:MAG: glycosyltransferase family 4 protein [Fusobacterium sp.]|nr:glycosyltransferase family 4 protein [Fusobacterium sp.]
MRILFLIGSLAGGGAERVVSELANSMVEKKDKVSIITVASDKKCYYISPKVKLIDCSQRTSVVGINFLKRINEIRKWIKEIKPDVIISFTVAVNIYSVLSCIGLEPKLILAERNDPRFDPASKVARILRKLLYPLADNYVFQTNGEKEFFSKKIQKRSSVIPNPVNPNLPRPYEGKREKRFVTAVRLEPQKNIKMAIDAFRNVVKKHQDYIFEIYGEGPLYNDLQEYINELSLSNSVFLMGRTDKLYERIRKASGFVLSSDYEGISNSMIEAMALGLPTISTDYPSGGARDMIITGENGWLVPVGNSEKMSSIMCEVIENNEKTLEIRRNAVGIRDKLDVNKIRTMWIDYIKRCI